MKWKVLFGLSVTCFLSSCSDTLPDACETKNPIFTLYEGDPEDGRNGTFVQQGQQWDCGNDGQWNSVISWKDGELHGKRILFDVDNGRQSANSRITSEKFYKEGEQHGKQTDYHKTGEPYLETHFKEGTLHGKAIEYYVNGQKRSEQSYEEGKEIGNLTRYYESGQKSSEVPYKDGEKHGRLLTWDEQGNRTPDRDSEWVNGRGSHIRAK